MLVFSGPMFVGEATLTLPSVHRRDVRPVGRRAALLFDPLEPQEYKV
jgi:hypothetical protein